MKKLSKKQKKLLKARKGKGQGKPSHVSQQEIDLLYVTAARFFEAGKKKEAEGYLKKVVNLHPSHHGAFNLLGLACADSGLYDDALQYFIKAIDCEPSQASYFNNLGNCYKARGDFSKAATCYQKGIDLGPDHLEKHLSNKAFALIELGCFSEAIVCFEMAIEFMPNFAEAYKGLGSVYKSLGDFEKARETYQKAIKIEPAYATAYSELSTCKKYTSSNDEEIRAMQTLLEQDTLHGRDKVYLCFGLGKALNDCMMYDEAFKYYQLGNTLKLQESGNIDFEQMLAEDDKLISFFSKSFFEENDKCGSLSKKPVFIVGMPRSGTSLVEQIVASHSQVHGAGELPLINDYVEKEKSKGQFPEAFGRYTERKWQELASHYEQFINSVGKENTLKYTDKMPWNYAYLGLIYLLFPKAKIIHCQRNPFDTCLSNFFQIYQEGNFFSYDLKMLGMWYRQYARMMDHWKAVLPLDMLEVSYEEIVAATETQSKKLIDFLELDWEESCLDFYKSKREVKTASAWQVRQPIYKSSTQRWKNYEHFLGPLKETLKI